MLVCMENQYFEHVDGEVYQYRETPIKELFNNEVNRWQSMTFEDSSL